MPTSTANSTTKSGIETSADGASFIPSSKRADGSTRKEIRVRPGYRPPEDVETYKNRSAEAWKSRGSGGVPGAETVGTANGNLEAKSKNAKRREAARKKAQENAEDETALTSAMESQSIAEQEKLKDWRDPSKLVENPQAVVDEEADRQKKIRNLVKKLKAVRDLKQKKVGGEKLSHDQLMKIGKESELVRDLQKLDYDGAELTDGNSEEIGLPKGDGDASLSD